MCHTSPLGSFSQFLAGPVSAMRLADLGARVIKIERPGTGDIGRTLAFAGIASDGDTLSFHIMNRNKESFAADLKNSDGLREVWELVKKADVIIQNFRPGVIERLGLGYEDVKKVNPGIIYGSATGYGAEGPFKDRPGQDLLAQSISGLPWLNGRAGDPPIPVGLAVADIFTSTHLASGVIAAQLPIGEYVTKIESYLGKLMIGTNKGVRVAAVSDVTGDLIYGPLTIEAENTGLDFAFRDTYVWVTGSIDGYAGLYRINLDNELETLRFAYATDAFLDGVSGYATSVDFVGNTNQIAFTTSGSNGIAIQSTTDLSTSGYLTTGNIRYGTLEPKNFKRLLGRGDFTYGSMTLETVDKDGVEYDHIAYDSSILPIEVGTSNPATAQEYVAYKFILYRDATTSSLGPTFKGYQAKATIATPRQRIVRFPVYCFDVETDRFNTVVGYEGRAFDRIQLLEDIEETGDVLTWQDLSTGESRQAVIEQVTFTRMTPPDKRFDGFGGVLEITIRTV